MRIHAVVVDSGERNRWKKQAWGKSKSVGGVYWQKTSSTALVVNKMKRQDEEEQRHMSQRGQTTEAENLAAPLSVFVCAGPCLPFCTTFIGEVAKHEATRFVMFGAICSSGIAPSGLCLRSCVWMCAHVLLTFSCAELLDRWCHVWFLLGLGSCLAHLVMTGSGCYVFSCVPVMRLGILWSLLCLSAVLDYCFFLLLSFGGCSFRDGSELVDIVSLSLSLSPLR